MRIAVAFILCAISSAALADEDLVAKRQACQQEARSRIKPTGQKGQEALQRLVERRHAYVVECMARR